MFTQNQIADCKKREINAFATMLSLNIFEQSPTVSLSKFKSPEMLKLEIMMFARTMLRQTELELAISFENSIKAAFYREILKTTDSRNAFLDNVYKATAEKLNHTLSIFTPAKQISAAA
jgi:hypothetical protein